MLSLDMIEMLIVAIQYRKKDIICDYKIAMNCKKYSSRSFNRNVFGIGIPNKLNLYTKLMTIRVVLVLSY